MRAIGNDPPDRDGEQQMDGSGSGARAAMSAGLTLIPANELGGAENVSVDLCLDLLSLGASWDPERGDVQGVQREPIPMRRIAGRRTWSTVAGVTKTVPAGHADGARRRCLGQLRR